MAWLRRMNHQPTIVLHVRPAPGNWQAPPEKRLARLLKAMLRGYGWRCIACKTISGNDAGSNQERTKQWKQER
jgi:hypothetical protein